MDSGRWLYSMRLLCVLVAALACSAHASAGDDKVVLLSKRQIVNSTHTLVVFFHDRGVETVSDCQREIQRGYRGQWRYYNHSFPRPRGYSLNTDYHCLEAAIDVDPWYEHAPYDYIYQIDIRSDQPQIRRMNNYADCLNDLRQTVRDETRKFFCAKLSQTVRL